MQFTPAGASAAHQKLGAGPSGPSVKAASASGAPQRARAAQSAKLMASGHRVRVCRTQIGFLFLAVKPRTELPGTPRDVSLVISIHLLLRVALEDL